MFQSKNLIYFLLAVFLGILLGIGFVSLLRAKKNYYAVFLNNGAIYFGKLSTFPRLKLDEAVFLQLDQNGQVSGVSRFKDAFWGPKGPIYLNRDSILFIAPLSETSPLVNFIEGRQVTPSPQPPAQPNQTTTSPTTSPSQ